MALLTPTLLAVPAFDATNEYTFIFTATGTSSQIVANQLIIRNNTTNDIVYQEKQESFKYEHILNADELQNGVYYNATLTVFDAQDNESPASIPIQFWCYTTPIIEITNFPTNEIITNANFNFEMSYNQNENEKLNVYQFNLYNSSQVLLSSSGELYADDGTPPFTGNYLFAGFENNTVYFIELVCITVEGTTVTTNLQQFTVQYIRPDIFTLVQLTNNCDEGYITVKSNVVVINGTSNPDPPTYIENKEVDLTEDNSWVKWDEGFRINEDFLARLWFRKPNPYTQILQFSNIQGQTIQVNFMLGYESINSPDMQAYVEIYVNAIDGLPYYIYSNYIDILDDTQYYNLWLTRENDIYSLQLAEVT